MGSENWHPPWLQKFLYIVDIYSYDIYLTHMIYVTGILSLLNVTNFFVINIAITLSAIIISAVVLHWICTIIRGLKHANFHNHPML